MFESTLVYSRLLFCRTSTQMSIDKFKLLYTFISLLKVQTRPNYYLNSCIIKKVTLSCKPSSDSCTRGSGILCKIIKTYVTSFRSYPQFCSFLSLFTYYTEKFMGTKKKGHFYEARNRIINLYLNYCMTAFTVNQVESGQIRPPLL